MTLNILKYINPKLNLAPSPLAPISIFQPSQIIENPAYIKNRIEVLRLLLSSCSSCLFSGSPSSRWTSTACSLDSPKAVELFHSLVNTVMGYNPGKGVMPYSGVFGGEGKREVRGEGGDGGGGG